MGKAPLLEGLSVLDIASFIAGPAAATVLGDLGADVVKHNPRPADRPHPPSAPEGSYRTADDRWLLLAFVNNDKQMPLFLRATGHPQAAEDPQFRDSTSHHTHASSNLAMRVLIPVDLGHGNAHLTVDSPSTWTKSKKYRHARPAASASTARPGSANWASTPLRTRICVRQMPTDHADRVSRAMTPDLATRLRTWRAVFT